MFLAVDRFSKFVHVTFLDANTKMNGAAFLREVVPARVSSGSLPIGSTPC